MDDWQDVTDGTYWNPGADTSWNGSGWFNSTLEAVSLVPGSWASGYVPTRLRFSSPSVPALWILFVTASVGDQFAVGVLPDTEIDLTHSGDISQVQFIGNLGDGTVLISNVS